MQNGHPRRTFLKTAALGGLGLAFSGKLSALQSLAAHSGKRIGVIGLDTEHGPTSLKSSTRQMRATNTPACALRWHILMEAARSNPVWI